MCEHRPRRPDALALDRRAARVVPTHQEQRWSLLRNPIVVFDVPGEPTFGVRAISAAPVRFTTAA